MIDNDNIIGLGDMRVARAEHMAAEFAEMVLSPLVDAAAVTRDAAEAQTRAIARLIAVMAGFAPTTLADSAAELAIYPDGDLSWLEQELASARSKCAAAAELLEAARAGLQVGGAVDPEN